MDSEQKLNLIERMYIGLDKMDISQEQKDYFKAHFGKLMDKIYEDDSWDPYTKAYLDGMEKIDQLVKEKKAGTVCLLHNCEKCPKEEEHEVDKGK